MAALPDKPKAQAPQAPIWTRLGVRLGLMLPKGLRRTLGIYRWNEVLSARPANVSDAAAYEAGNGIPPVFPGMHRAVSRLVDAGISFPASRAPWPYALEYGACSYNTDVVWCYSMREMQAWMQVWKGHPQEQKYLDQALAVAAANTEHEMMRILLRKGASPAQNTQRFGYALDRLFSSDNISRVLACLDVLAPTQHQWEWPAPDFYVRLWNVQDLEDMKKTGIELPLAWQRELALERFHDPEMSDVAGGESIDQIEAAMAWWWSEDRLGGIPGERALMLSQLLTSIRPGDDEEHQRTLLRYWETLFPENPVQLPPEPKDGTERTWAHRWAGSSFPASVPQKIVEDILAQPSTVLDDRDHEGKTVREIFDERCESQGVSGENPGYPKIRALLDAAGLAENTKAPSADVAGAFVRTPTRRL